MHEALAGSLADREAKVYKLVIRLAIPKILLSR